MTSLPEAAEAPCRIAARWIAPVGRTLITDGCIDIDQTTGRIRAIFDDAHAAPRLPANTPTLDIGDALLTPGLVNPHAHLDLTAYRGLIKPCDLWDWLRALIALRQDPDRAAGEPQAVHDGADECLRFGVTCVGDISRQPENWQLLAERPLRRVLFVELLSLARSAPNTLQQVIELVEALESTSDERTRVGISPHAPYTVPLPEIRAALAFADARSIPWTIHWAETLAEVAYLTGDDQKLPAIFRQLQATAGMQLPTLGPTATLEQISAELPSGVLAHVNYLDAPDAAERIARLGHTVIYCPRAHAYYGHDAHPWLDLHRAGVPVALGTDSAASNDDLNLLAEAHYLWRHHRGSLAPQTLLEMVTHVPAQSLGWGDQLGRIEVGYHADLVAFPYDRSTCMEEPSDPIAWLLETLPAPQQVWIGGKRVAGTPPQTARAARA